jgi:hypothetical protein
MPSPVDPGASKSQAEPLGLPPGFKIGSPFPFAGLNVADSRIAIDDHEFSWLENYVRIGKGHMRTAWDVGPPLYAAPSPRKIVSFFWFNIGPETFCAVFLDNGVAIQVSLDGSGTPIGSTTGQFYQAGASLPACCAWGTQYLLISNNLTANSYWVWDGTLLYGAGGVSPTVDLSSGGSGYTSAPTVTAFGGAGSGATFAATIENGSVVQVVPTAVGTGYGPADIVQLQFSGGGTDTGAILEAVLTAGTVSNLILTSGGSGYTSVPAVALTGGGGTGATAIATLTPGGVGSITLGAGGTGYTSAPAVIITGGGGSGATATAVVASGVVTAIDLTNVGTGYTSVPTIHITGVGTGATATALLAGGVIASVAVTDGGSGYTGSPTVAFSGGGGTGAAAVSVLSAGTIASVTIVNGGTNFTGTPTLTFTGGGGINAAATAVVTGGVITGVTMTAGGSGYTSVPAVEVETGLNNAASATVEMMPIGVSGSAMETFQSRVWLDHPFQAGTVPSGGTINISAPGSFTDFATSDGGLIFVNSDRFLRYQYTTLRQSNGYLYTVGDSSVSVISNVQTSGSTPTTTFNALNVDPQTGSSWRDSCQDYARTILFANPFGVFGVYGGAVTKTSKKLDPLFNAAIYPPDTRALTPSAAVANLFSQRIYLLLLTITDPFTGNPRNVMVGWDETDWTVYSQSAALVYVGTQEINSDLQAWGTDGTSLYPLFNAASDTLAKTLQTKLYSGETAFTIASTHAIYVTAENQAAGQTSITFSSTTVDAIGVASPLSLPAWMEDEVTTQGGSFEMTDNPIAFSVPTSGMVTFGTGTSPPIAGTGVGLTMVTSAPDFILANLQLGYLEIAAIA